jgi:hypothetical protein
VVTLQTALLMLLQAITISVALVAAYVLCAWVLVRKFGAWSLWTWWLLVAAAVSAVVLRRAHLVDTPQVSPFQWWFAGTLGLMLFLGFGLSALSVRRGYQRDPNAALTVGPMLRGVGAFFAGIAVVLLAYLVLDVRRLLAR